MKSATVCKPIEGGTDQIFNHITCIPLTIGSRVQSNQVKLNLSMVNVPARNKYTHHGQKKRKKTLGGDVQLKGIALRETQCEQGFPQGGLSAT